MQATDQLWEDTVSAMKNFLEITRYLDFSAKGQDWIFI